MAIIPGVPNDTSARPHTCLSQEFYTQFYSDNPNVTPSDEELHNHSDGGCVLCAIVPTRPSTPVDNTALQMLTGMSLSGLEADIPAAGIVWSQQPR